MKRIKTIITLFFAMFISVSFAQLNLDFETAHNFTTFDPGQAVYTQLANPFPGGINTSASVGKVIRLTSASTYSGCKITNLPAINFSTNGTLLTMNVYTTAPIGTKIVVKIEQGGTAAEHAQFTKVSGAWEKMSWDMKSETNLGRTLVIMPGFGTVGNGTATSTFYFDNIKQEVGAPVIPPPTPSGTATLNFEPTGIGQAIRWSVFENGVGTTALAFVANPSVDAVNPSATVAYIAGDAIPGDWLGAESAYGDVGPITWSSSLMVVKVKVYTNKATTVAIKMGVNILAQRELRVATTKINQWEELTFDFTSYIGQANTTGMNSFTIHPSAQLPNPSLNFYFDDVTFTGGAVALQVPTVAAPTPTKANADVIAVFSDLLTSDPAVWTNTIVVTDWVATGNADASYVEFPIAGNMATKMASIVQFGIGTVAKNIAEMKKFHIDIWTPNITSLTISLNGVEKVYTPTLNAWNPYDIDLAEFGSPTTLNANGIAFKAQPYAAGVLYYDNIYFHKNPATGVKSVELSDVSVYPNPTMGQLRVSAEQIISEITVRNLVGQSVKTVTVNGLEKTIDLSTISSGNYFVTLKLADGRFTTRKIVKL